MRSLLLILSIIFLVVACKSKSGKKEEELIVPTISAADSLLLKQQKDSTLLSLTKDVLTVIKNKKYDSLALFIHPDEGVRFSPNAYIDTAVDKIFTIEIFKKDATAKKHQKFTWGEYDGSGDPINLTIDEYFKRFVYDVDFLTPETRKVNEFIGGSNSQTTCWQFTIVVILRKAIFPGSIKNLMEWTGEVSGLFLKLKMENIF